MDKITPLMQWMIKRDMPQVLAIEDYTCAFPWSNKDFTKTLHERTCIGIIGEHDGKVVGFMVYDLSVRKISVLKLSVHRDFRRRGVGTAMVKRLIGRLNIERRTRIILPVRETNLASQLFLRKLGFASVSILKDYYNEFTTEDAYLFQYRISEHETEEITSNRFSLKELFQ